MGRGAWRQDFAAIWTCPRRQTEVVPLFGVRSAGDRLPNHSGLRAGQAFFRRPRGFSYFETSASASITGSLFEGAHVSYDFVQPWLGFRANYYPSPHWRIDLRASATGLAVDSSVWGWNALLGASYLITRWLDVTLGYAALATDRHGKTGLDGSSRKLSLTTYGPVAAVGFRF